MTITLKDMNMNSACNRALISMTINRMKKYHDKLDFSDPSQLTFKEMRACLGKTGGKIISNENSKMPGYTISTAAHQCKTGSKLARVKGSICSSCYAFKGNYFFKSVQKGLQGNSIAIEYFEQLKDYTIWVVTLSELIKRRCIVKEIKDKQGNVIGIEDFSYFRFHDSGDIQSVDHLNAINEVAKNNPSVSFWLPTREYKFVQTFLKNNNFATNLCVRLSAHMVGKKPQDFKTGLPTSTVSHKESQHHCIAPQQNGACDGEKASCRNCWDPNIQNVNYKIH